jgi:hypothetical protein
LLNTVELEIEKASANENSRKKGVVTSQIRVRLAVKRLILSFWPAVSWRSGEILKNQTSAMGIAGGMTPASAPQTMPVSMG